jgi:zinc transport system substrate-binding protein
MPDAAGWQQLQELRKDHPARWMIWEAEPLPEVKNRLQEQSVGCVVFQPCGNAPDSGDFLAVMRANLNAMQAVFQHDGGDDSSL